MVMPRHLRHGARGEKLAARWLARRGLRLVQTNYRCPGGELDLIMLDNDCLVIVEVRVRKHSAFGGGLGSITQSKIARIVGTTRDFLHKHPQYSNLPLRFDVIAIGSDTRKPEIEWRRHAFVADDLPC